MFYLKEQGRKHPQIHSKGEKDRQLEGERKSEKNVCERERERDREQKEIEREGQWERERERLHEKVTLH